MSQNTQYQELNLKLANFIQIYIFLQKLHIQKQIKISKSNYSLSYMCRQNKPFNNSLPMEAV